ncbi:MAG: hypothetical protein MZV70_45400 [Desulfobacterales bacterium]|nr:hypothetical protein [Desulfobacterales bacterium]
MHEPPGTHPTPEAGAEASPAPRRAPGGGEAGRHRREARWARRWIVRRGTRGRPRRTTHTVPRRDEAGEMAGNGAAGRARSPVSAASDPALVVRRRPGPSRSALATRRSHGARPPPKPRPRSRDPRLRCRHERPRPRRCELARRGVPGLRRHGLVRGARDPGRCHRGGRPRRLGLRSDLVGQRPQGRRRPARDDPADPGRSVRRGAVDPVRPPRPHL